MGPSEDARIALLERLIDHAPLFPPASLTLAAALDEDRRAQASRSAFALARFVCPAFRLGRLGQLSRLAGYGRALSVVLDAPLEESPSVEAVEAPPGVDLDSLPALAPEVYVEVLLDDDLDERLDAVAGLGLRAKVRCGGETAPTVEALAHFVRACRERTLVFKATAGLHHAVRQDGEHGFLNLLAAVVFGDEEAALREEDPTAFRVARDGFRWRGRAASPEEVTRARRERLHSIGSCSFFEPIEELEAMGALPL